MSTVEPAETERREALKRELKELLAEVRSARGNGITDEEYQELRAEALGRLASAPRPPGGVVFAFVAFGSFGVVGSVWCVRNELQAAAVGAIGFAAVCGAALVANLRRCAVERRVPLGDRLRILDELVATGFVSADEASSLKGRIEAFCIGQALV